MTVTSLRAKELLPGSLADRLRRLMHRAKQRATRADRRVQADVAPRRGERLARTLEQPTRRRPSGRGGCQGERGERGTWWLSLDAVPRRAAPVGVQAGTETQLLQEESDKRNDRSGKR